MSQTAPDPLRPHLPVHLPTKRPSLDDGLDDGARVVAHLDQIRLERNGPGFAVPGHSPAAHVHADELEHPREHETEDGEVRDVRDGDARAKRRRLGRDLLDGIVQP